MNYFVDTTDLDELVQKCVASDSFEIESEGGLNSLRWNSKAIYLLYDLCARVV